MYVWGCERSGRDTDEQTASDHPSAQGELSGLHGVRWTGTLSPAGQTLGAPIRSPGACVVAGDTLCLPWFVSVLILKADGFSSGCGFRFLIH